VVVNDCVDDTGGRPGTEDVVGLLALKPGRESTRVAATNDNPFRLGTVCSSEGFVLLIDEVGCVGKSLLGSKVLQVLCGPVVKRLRGTVVSVLE